MKSYILIALFLFPLILANAQTIVKMTVPTQAKEQVSVVVLFDEQVPEGMPVVLGLMGYNVKGGIEPYTYQWMQNGTVIGTGDVVIIIPKKGDTFSLKATDKNICYSTTSFNMKVIGRVNEQKEEENGFKIYPTFIKDDIIHIDLLTSEKLIPANIRIFDLKSNLIFQTFATGSYIIDFI